VVPAGIAVALVGGELGVPFVAGLGGATAVGAGIARVIHGPSISGSGKNLSSKKETRERASVSHG
jgi:hypothetical protein